MLKISKFDNFFKQNGEKAPQTWEPLLLRNASLSIKQSLRAPLKLQAKPANLGEALRQQKEYSQCASYSC